jgi:virulence factor
VRIALIGLGDIARKAYLPVLGTRDDIELCLVTRDRSTLDALGDAYRVRDRFSSVDEALPTGLDAAFVHAATTAHHEIVSRLLAARVPVYVDKPLDPHLDRATRMVELAESVEVSLMVGFNRRHAPAYRALSTWEPPDLVLLQKHRTGLADEPRRVVFDDFIHVVDTLRFLGRIDADSLDITARTTSEGLLEQVTVALSDGRRLAAGMMSRTSGATEEVLEVIGAGRKRRVRDLAESTHYEDGECVAHRDEWRPVGQQRGFSDICEHFLSAVRDGRRLSARDALATHRLCERIVEHVRRGV